MSAIPRIDAFLSYHSNDRDTAKTVKEKLGEVGIEVFMAPDDIDGGAKFLSVMYEKIKSCQVFISLLSKDYPNSEYSDHEIGIALGFQKPVLPICIDQTVPYGFLRDYHCICNANEEVTDKIQEIADTIFTLTDVGKEYIDLLISNLENADSFVNASHWANKLWKYSKFSQDQIMKIANARLSNDQIYNSFMACPTVDEILEKQKHALPSELRTQLSI